jgi:hypothetical protein
MTAALNAVIARMVAADHLRHPLSLDWESTYDQRFLNEVVRPALGGSAAPLRARPPSMLDRFRGRVPASTASAELTVRYRTWVAKPDRWRHEELAVSGEPVRTYGCDGIHRWHRADGKVQVRDVEAGHPAHRLGDAAWQNIPEPALRELLDPSLALAALSVATAEMTGDVLRLTGASRNADLLESALVSPWAAACRVDVNPVSGLVVAAVNTDDAGSVVRQHVVTRLDLTAAVADDVFAPPSR